MNSAFPMQKFQDWFTQQWVILGGRKINPCDYTWLTGPFGELNGIGDIFIHQLAQKENLSVVRNAQSKGLLPCFSALELEEKDLEELAPAIIDFYERTSDYTLRFNVSWNPIFKIFGHLVNRLFSRRINQLNIPIRNIQEYENITSEIIQLISEDTTEVKYTIWLRRLESTGQIIYSGIYSTCRLPSGTTCIKAIFPLPKGNATVILKPSLGQDNTFILESSGKRFGDAGFYFLLHDSKGHCWSRFIRSFTDRLILREEEGMLKAVQIFKLWCIKVARFDYSLLKRKVSSGPP